MCDHDRDLLLKKRNHYIAVTGAGHVARIRKSGNEIAYYHNSMNDGFLKKQSGATFGASMYRTACQIFGSCKKVPKWWIINEISAKRWGSGNAAYIKYVTDLTKTLAAKKLHVIVAAPFDNPQRNSDGWNLLARYGYIGIENYVSGKELKAQHFDANWLKAQYQMSVDAFKAFGISKKRLFVFESYGSTLANKVFGRAGISTKDWIKTIQMRAKAIHAVKFKGFISYGWWGNQMTEDWKTRDKFYSEYNKHAHLLP